MVQLVKHWVFFGVCWWSWVQSQLGPKKNQKTLSYVIRLHKNIAIYGNHVTYHVTNLHNDMT